MTLKSSPQSSYSTSGDGGRVLRIFLWVLGGLIGIGLLCCLCSLAALWFTGDFFVEFMRSLPQ
jgi:hypothetical protein